MKKILNIFTIIIISIILLFSLTGCESETKENILEEKVLAELEYMEENIFDILKKYLKGNYIVDSKTDWNAIRVDYNKILNDSSLMVLDLTNLGLSNDRIIEFENRLNNISFTIENKAEITFLDSIKNLYSLVPEYLNNFYNNNGVYLEKRINLYLMESVYSCMIDDFTSAENYINEAEIACQNLMNDIEYLNENAYSVNKKFVEIQEMKISIQNRLKENTLAKYVSVI